MSQEKTRIIPWEKARAIGGRLKIAVEPIEKKSEVIEVIEFNQGQEQRAKEWGIIVDIGKGAFGPNSAVPDEDVKVGDLAIYPKYAGTYLGVLDNTIIVALNDDHVWLVIPKEDLDTAGYDSSYAKADEVRQTFKQFKAFHPLEPEVIKGGIKHERD